MPLSGYFIDANLLVLLVAGNTGTHIITRHKRLKQFTVGDYRRLRELIFDAGGVVYVTPNTLTEASNLLRNYGEPDKTRLSNTLATLINESQEVVVYSADAVANAAYQRLGLADAALLEVISADRPLLTVDAPLVIEAQRLQADAAVNFNEFRGWE